LFEDLFQRPSSLIRFSKAPIQEAINWAVEKDIQTSNHADAGSGFKPGNIHLKKDYWEQFLLAGKWVMDVINFGYCIPFFSHPTEYEAANNASAIKHMSYVNKTVQDWAKLGIIEFVKDKPWCVSPLTVAERKADGKLRLCWDGSRHVNTYIDKQKVTLDHLNKALELTQPGDLQFKYDLKSAFFHIKINENHTKFLGAAIKDSEGGKLYFIFKYLPFGLSSAVHAMTKMFKPINANLHKKGIRHSIYIDDGRLLAKTETEMNEIFMSYKF